MVPRLASLACFVLIAALFRSDVKKRDLRVSLVPLVWMFISGSRWVSSWLDMSPPMDSADALAEGSPIDRAAFFVLIVWGAMVLSRREIDWRRFFRQNLILVLYFLYALASMLWAPDAFVVFKRWFKDLGNPIMALVILTELRPYESVGITLRRLSFLLIPLSVLFVKYYPDLGRAYHHDGSPMYTGVGHQKNDLGLMCLTAGLYFAWKIFQRRQSDTPSSAEKADIYDFGLVAMMMWLLLKSDSQTSLVCVVAATLILLVSRLPIVSKRPSRTLTVVVVAGMLYVVLQSTIQIKDQILEMLGRDPTLTSRTEIWSVVGDHEGNPIVGVGFMSFWTGDRLEAIWRDCDCGINQAHNGYLEQYVNLGYVGVAFIGLIMITALWKVRSQLDRDPSAALLRLCIIVVAALYNYTEASFYGISNVWLLLLLASFDVSGVTRDHVAPALNTSPAPAVPRAVSVRTRVRTQTPPGSVHGLVRGTR
jgi:exopolysaccharide production protein ExoQ